MLERVLFHTISIALNRITQNFDQNDLKLEILSMEDFENKYHYKVRLNNDSYKIVFEKDNAVTLSGFVTIFEQCSTDKEYKFYIDKLNDVISVYSNLTDYDVHIQLDVAKLLQIRIKENKKIAISTITFNQISSFVYNINHTTNVPVPPIVNYNNDLIQNLFVLSDAKGYKIVKCWDIVYFGNESSGVLICTIGNKHIFALIDKIDNTRKINIFNTDFKRLIQYNKTSESTYYTCDYEQQLSLLRLTKSYSTNISSNVITVISSNKKYTYDIDGSNVTFKQI